MSIRWEKSGTASLVSLLGDAVVLRSSVPSPPGSRIDGVLVADENVRVRFKIHSSKKQDDGSFLLTGRPIDLTTETREKLVATLAS